MALVLDHEGVSGYFEEERGRFLLWQLDLMYACEGWILAIERGSGSVVLDSAALDYWAKKLAFCDYLSTNPLVFTLVNAGCV